MVDKKKPGYFGKKRFSVLSGILLLVSLTVAGYFLMNERGYHKEVKTNHAEGPAFRKDGLLWMMEANNNDTLQLIEIEIANDNESIERGLMYRRSMDENKGMLFIFPDERPRSFWMKNTYIPLDIIFVNSQMEIVSIKEHNTQLGEWSIPSEKPAMYVVEVNAGFCGRHGIKTGDKIFFSKI